MARPRPPGVTRVDVEKDGSGCRTVWNSNEVSPTVVPKVSIENGLVYLYTKPAREDDVDAWYFTALDFCTGVRQYRQLTGTGLGYNNNYAPITIGPDGTGYVGVLGGLVRVADAVVPHGPEPGRPRGCAPKPRLKLALSARHGPSCLRPPVTATLAGKDLALARRVRFRLGGRTRTDAKPPFRAGVVNRGARAGTRMARARVTLEDGRGASVRKRFRICARAAVAQPRRRAARPRFTG